MDPSRPKVPAEAIDAYNEFIHGHLDRRRFLEQLKTIAGAGAAMALYEALTPNYAAAQQVTPTDSRLKTSRETVPSPMGNGEIKGYLVRPASAGSNKLPGHSRRPRKPRPQSAYRRHRAAARDRELHGLRSRRLDARSAAIRAMTSRAARRSPKSTAPK